MRALPLIALLAASWTGCAEEATRFPVVITAMTDDGKPMPELPVTLGKSPAGKTDAEGKLKIRVVGKEGQKIAVAVQVPKGYRQAPGAPSLVLRRLADIEGGGGKTLPVEHTIKLMPLERKYPVLVRVGVAGLPIETFGTQQAVTNSKGVAMFLYPGAPGDELQVKVSTASRPELRPQNPTVSFLLAQRAEAYVVKQSFASYKAPSNRPKKPKHVGPKRL